MKIKYIDYAVAFRLKDKIYMNKHLKKYPELFNAILNHEKKHSNDFIWNDIVLDLNNRDLKGFKKEYYLFILKHPRSLYQFLPFMTVDDVFTLDVIMLSLWLLLLLVMSIMIYFLK